MEAQLVGTYDYVKGGSMETYTQECVLNANGTASYKEFQETRSEAFTRSGNGTWKVDGETLWITCPELRKETKAKMKVGGTTKDEIKTDYNIAVDIKVNDLLKAGPSGPNAPKSRWRKKM